MIGTLVADGRLNETDALNLTNTYVRGDVDAPEILVAFLMDRLNALARSAGATDTGGLDAEIDKVRQAAAEDDHDLYRVVDKWLAVFPARRKAGIARMSRDGRRNSGDGSRSTGCWTARPMCASWPPAGSMAG